MRMNYPGSEEEGKSGKGLLLRVVGQCIRAELLRASSM